MPSPPPHSHSTEASHVTGPLTPPIPAPMAHLPVVAGLAVPWVTPVLPDGRHLFGAVDAARQEHCLQQHRCGVCGLALADRIVFLMRERDLPRHYSAEPGLHPWCAAYTIQACPMITGRLPHYRSTPRPLPPPTSLRLTPTDIANANANANANAEIAAITDENTSFEGDPLARDSGDGGLRLLLSYASEETPAQQQARRHAAAEAWFAVWVTDYTVGFDAAARSLAAWIGDGPPLRVRPIPALSSPAKDSQHAVPDTAGDLSDPSSGRG